MKKILLSVFAVASLAAANAQVYSCNDAAGFGTWTSFNNDSDTLEWTIVDLTGGGSALDSQGECVISNSWTQANGPLTPDNILVSPAIDLTGATGATLEWGAGSIESVASTYNAEHYAIYVMTAADVALIAGGTFPTPIFEETLSTGEVLNMESEDISSFAGQSGVYIAVRHYNCTDENFIVFDDVNVYGVFASVEENDLQVSVYPNPTNDVLNFTLNANAESVSIYGLDGKLISTEYVNAANGTIEVSNLTAGTYFYEFTTVDGVVSRSTFVKK